MTVPTLSTASPQAPLQARETALRTTLDELSSQRTALVRDALSESSSASDTLPNDSVQQAVASAQSKIKRHIKLLQQYNEIKDIGQGLMGLIAEQRDVRVVDVMADFDMVEKD